MSVAWLLATTAHRVASASSNLWLPRHPDAGKCPGRPDMALRTPVWITTSHDPSSRRDTSASAMYASSQLTAAQRQALSSPALEALRLEKRLLEEHVGLRRMSSAALDDVSFEPDPRWAMPRAGMQAQTQRQFAATSLERAFDGEGDEEDRISFGSPTRSRLGASSRPASASTLRSFTSAGFGRQPQRGLRVVASPSLDEVRVWEADEAERRCVLTLADPHSALHRYERRGAVSFPAKV